MEENNNPINQEEEKEESIKYLRRQWIYKTIAWFVILGCVIGVASSSITYYFTLKKKDNKFIASTYEIEKGETTTASDAIEDISKVLSTFAELVDDQYIGDIEKNELVTETVKGFINGIGDEYSEYMTAEDWEQYQEDALGNYSGVGIVMTAGDNGYILVTKVIKDSPAEAAGVKQSDYIIGVNGESIYEESTSDVASKVRGETGTEVTLNILRDDKETLEFTMKREKVRVYHVETEMLEDGIGYVYFNTFDTGCADEFEKEVDSLVEQGVKKIILDLRYNTGGAVDQALQILDLFLEKVKLS
ncbi:MAG: PDZ domain-containing protein [Clostridia bacterium]|nr:PDZ domain-containing protein [Clostridia bacterium]